MRSRGFTCPSLGSLFRPTRALSPDPSVEQVARAIYHKGRTDGAAGIMAAAHVIQNRCQHSGFPSEPLSVVAANPDHFPRGGQAPQDDSAGERRLYNQAVRYASQLVNPPQGLQFPDPTNGSIHYFEQPQNVVAAPSTPSSQRLEEAAGVGDQSAEEDLGVHEPPRNMPRKSRRPRSFFRRRNSAEEEPDVERDGSRSVERSSSAHRSADSTMQAPAHRGRSGYLGSAAQQQTAGSEASGSTSNRAASPSSTEAVTGCDRIASRVVGLGIEAPQRAAPPLSRLAVGPGSFTGIPGGSSLRPSLSSSSRPLTRPVYSGRTGLAGQSQPRPLLRGPQRGLGGGAADIYHDMLLPCGLFQEEAIDIMFRDLSPDDFEMLNKLDENLPKRNIVQRNTVDSLPQVEAQETGCTECGVCLVGLESRQRVCLLPCGHAFHQPCISRWLTECKNACPLCGAKIEQDAGTTTSSSAEADASAESGRALSDDDFQRPTRSEPGPLGRALASGAPPAGGFGGMRTGAAGGSASSASTPTYFGPLQI